MGCIICLEDFQDDDPSLRPSCLPCGHVYHHGCVMQWLQSRPAQYQKCPTCTKVYSVAQLITLWPADYSDLDRLLALKHSEEFEQAAQASDMDPDAARFLLNDLVDFNSAMQNYVSAVHGARAITTRVAGQRIVKLLRIDEERSIATDNLKVAMDRLATVIKSFEERHTKVLDREGKLKQAAAHWHSMSKDVQTKAALIQRDKEKLDAGRKSNEEKTQAIGKALSALRKDQIRVQEEQATLKTDREALQQDRIEFRQTMAQKESEVRIQLGMMQGKVDAAERLLTEANQARDETKEQNNKLADQLRELQRKYKEEQVGRAEERMKRKKLNEQYAKLEATNKRLVQVQSTPSKRVEDAGTSAAAIFSPSSGQKSQLRNRPSTSKSQHEPSISLVLSRDALVIDDEDEDEDFFPMPGLPPSKYKQQPAQGARTMIDLTNSSYSSSSSSPTPLSPSLRKQQTTAAAGSGSALGAEQLSRGWGVATGQKRKVRP